MPSELTDQGERSPVPALGEEMVITSPFVPHKRVVTRHARRNTSSSIDSPTSTQSGAIMGGVRRWMSMNKANVPVKRKRSRAHGSALEDVSESVQTREAGEEGTKKSANPTGAFPPLDVVLGRVQAPVVSAEEASEYEWYATQFADVSLSETHHIDEADIAMYEAGAALAAGEAERVEELVVVKEKAGETYVDPVLLAYASAVPGSRALAAKLEKVSEAKVRAYGQWVQSHIPK